MTKRLRTGLTYKSQWFKQVVYMYSTHMALWSYIYIWVLQYIYGYGVIKQGRSDV